MIIVTNKQGINYSFDMSGRKYRKFFGGNFQDVNYSPDLDFISNIKTITVKILDTEKVFNIPNDVDAINLGKIGRKTIKVGGGSSSPLKDVAECLWYVKDGVETKIIVFYENPDNPDITTRTI